MSFISRCRVSKYWSIFRSSFYIILKARVEVAYEEIGLALEIGASLNQ